MRGLLNTKLGRIGFLGLVIASSVFSVYSFVGLVRRTHVRFVDEDLGKAWAESQKLPAGFERGEDFLRRLKAIDTNYVPQEMKQALFDYIAAYERGLIAMEAGRDAPEQNKAMDQAKKRIIAIEEKYK